ncbi:hypothetical protein Z043_120137 [Scleropages formosus]|uniref:Uncharacterized protein n=1 Tax=Scleropages formosus TaxID=113540 RepID=A0A0P7U405_SCLFO|nr:hypothetical protein Z043_120137 [Scleropages formosus]
MTYEEFQTKFEVVFNYPLSSQAASDCPIQIQRESRSVAEDFLKFQRLVEQSSRNAAALLASFQAKLHSRI